MFQSLSVPGLARASLLTITPHTTDCSFILLPPSLSTFEIAFVTKQYLLPYRTYGFIELQIGERKQYSSPPPLSNLALAWGLPLFLAQAPSYADEDYHKSLLQSNLARFSTRWI